MRRFLKLAVFAAALLNVALAIAGEKPLTGDGIRFMGDRARRICATRLSVSFNDVLVPAALVSFQNSVNVSVSLAKAPGIKSAGVTLYARSINLDDLYYHIFLPRGYTCTLSRFGIEVLPLENASDNKTMGDRHLVLLSKRFPDAAIREAALRKKLASGRVSASAAGLSFKKLADVFQENGGCAVSLDPLVSVDGKEFDFVADDTPSLSALRTGLAKHGFDAVVLHGAVFVTTAEVAGRLRRKLETYRKTGIRPVAAEPGDYSLGNLSGILKKSAGVELVPAPSAKPMPESVFTVSRGMSLADLPERIYIQTGMKLILARTDRLNPFYLLDSDGLASEWAERIAGMPDTPSKDDMDRVAWRLRKAAAEKERVEKRISELRKEISGLNNEIVRTTADFQVRRAAMRAGQAPQEKLDAAFNAWRTGNKRMLDRMAGLSDENTGLHSRLSALERGMRALAKQRQYLDTKIRALGRREVAIPDRVRITLSSGIVIRDAVLVKCNEFLVVYELVGARIRLDAAKVKALQVKYNGEYVSVNPKTGKFMIDKKLEKKDKGK